MHPIRTRALTALQHPLHNTSCRDQEARDNSNNNNNKIKIACAKTRKTKHLDNRHAKTKTPPKPDASSHQNKS